jgi:hypothetical protein
MGQSPYPRTTPYTPIMIAVAPDGTFWTEGREWPKESPTLPPDACVIRHFDRSGKSVGCFVPQSTIRNSASLLRTRSTLRAASDRLVRYSGEGRYVEISLTGDLLFEADIPFPGNQSMNPGTGFAVTDSGEVFMNGSYDPLADSSNAGSRDGIFILDKSAKTWLPVPRSRTTPFVRIYGADGRRLAARGRSRK